MSLGSAGPATKSGKAAVGVSSRHVREKLELEEFIAKKLVAGGVRGQFQTHGDTGERAYPVEGELRLVPSDVGAFRGALADGEGGVVGHTPNR